MKNKSDVSVFGILITLFGGVLWGFSGVCGQYLFEIKGLSADWLVPYRLFFAGVLLVIFYVLRSPSIALAPLKNPANYLPFAIYGILGLMMTQYSYFYAIELSNAAVATVIQYSAPALILVIACYLERRVPRVCEFVALVLAMLGVTLLATHGDLSRLVVSPAALFWCAVSVAGVAVYNFAGAGLMSRYPVGLVLGWGMVFGGLVLAIFTRPWGLPGVSDFSGFAALVSVVFFGTVLAFSFYMTGVKLVGASKASMIAAIEPVSAAVFGHFWLGTSFVFLDFAGFALIISCIFLLAKKEK